MTQTNDTLEQLYEQFAEPLGLWECKLAILHCAGHYDAALVANVWQHIVDAEVRRLPAQADAAARMASLSAKIRTLGRLYANTSDQFFPLDLLVRTLEG